MSVQSYKRIYESCAYIVEKKTTVLSWQQFSRIDSDSDFSKLFQQLRSETANYMDHR